jgi:hypothetical protein
MEWGPIPVKERETVSYPANTTLYGVWTIDELRAAESHGCNVEILSSFTSTSHTTPFGNWWDIVRKGRQELGGGTAKLVKACSNTLWGKFLSGGTADWRYFVDGEMVIVPEKWNEKPRSPALAGMVAGRVRARLFTEALSQHPVIACHTDGVITPDTEHLSPNTGAPGRWRLKDAGSRLELVSAQAFRYKRHGEGYTYRLSGVKPNDAPRVFSRMMRPFRRPKPDLPSVEYNDLFYDKWEAPPETNQTALPL